MTTRLTYELLPMKTRRPSAAAAASADPGRVAFTAEPFDLATRARNASTQEAHTRFISFTDTRDPSRCDRWTVFQFSVLVHPVFQVEILHRVYTGKTWSHTAQTGPHTSYKYTFISEGDVFPAYEYFSDWTRELLVRAESSFESSSNRIYGRLVPQLLQQLE